MQFPEKDHAEIPSSVEKLIHAGDELLKRAKMIARESEERVRKALGTDTPPQGTHLDPTDEVPPLTSEASPVQ